MNKVLFKNKNNLNQKGFSIIEMIVAVTIIIFAILGPMTIAKKSLASASYAKDQITAYYLAEESIEYARYLRDINNLQKRDFLYGFNHCLNDGGGDTKGCALDTRNAPESQICSSVSDSKCKLYQQVSDSGSVSYPFYTHKNISGNTNTIFSRIVRIKKILNSANVDVGQEERLIEVEVMWQTGNLPARSIFLRGYLLDWKEQPADKFDNI